MKRCIIDPGLKSWAAEERTARLRGRRQAIADFFRVREGGQSSLPQPRISILGTLGSSILGAWLMAAALLVCGVSPSPAQAPHVLGSRPDVLVLVFAVPGGPDQVGLTYPGVVPHAQALRDVHALQAATGWNVTGMRITDQAAPIQKATGKMTGVDFAAPGVVLPQSHTLPVEPFVSSLRGYHHVTLTYLVGSGFAFQGLRDYADNHVKISLAQRGSAYTYQIYYHDGNFRRLNLPRYQLPIASARSAQTSGARRINPWLLGLVALAAVGAGCIVYAVLARNA